MHELISGELVVIEEDPLRVGQMRVNRIARRAVLILWLSKMSIKQIQQKNVDGDLKSRDKVAPAGSSLPERTLLWRLWGGRADESGLRPCQADGGSGLLGEARSWRHGE